MRAGRKKLQLAPGQPDKFNAIQKVCAILRVLAQRSPLRLTEIADATSLNKATSLRILASLIEEGFVSRVAGAKTYELGQEARVMAVGARRSVDIAELAQPSLLRLSEKSADTALLSVRSGVEALYLARSVGSHPLQPNYLQIGSRRPLGVGAGSLALMVWLPDAEIEAIIEHLLDNADAVLALVPPRFDAPCPQPANTTYVGPITAPQPHRRPILAMPESWPSRATRGYSSVSVRRRKASAPHYRRCSTRSRGVTCARAR